MNNLLSFTYNKRNHQKHIWGDLCGSSLSLALSQLAQQENQHCLIVTPDNVSAAKLKDEIQFYTPYTNGKDINIFPDWEILPYDNFSPHEDIISQRLTVLHDLRQKTSGITIIPIATLMHRLPPPDYIEKHSFAFQINQKLDRDALRARLQRNSYVHVSKVLEHGEYSIRGSIIDIFPMGNDLPLRIDLFDNEIDAIKTFDPDTQLSIENCQEIQILPARETPLSDDAVQLFRRNWRSRFNGNPIHCPIYEDVSQTISPAGIEYYLPLFFESTATFFDYLPPNTTVVQLHELHDQAEQFWQELTHRHEQRNYDITQPILSPKDVCQTVDEVFAHFQKSPQILFSNSTKDKNAHSFDCHALPKLTVDHKLENPLIRCQAFINEKHYKILLVAQSTGRREALLDLLRQIKLSADYTDSWQSFLENENRLQITEGHIERGFIAETLGIAVITENELFSSQVIQNRQRKNKRFETEVIVRDLTELRFGSPIVHIQHGVGRYLGLSSIQTSGEEAEYLTIEYADHDKIYVPITSLHLISRYSGIDEEHAPINKLGSDKWSREKKKAIEKIRDVAAELLEIYAKREASQGFQYKLPIEYATFTSTFPFEPTLDQQNAIDKVIEDMSNTKPMDRLVCGDVGFGKTEVALRAAFIAALNAKQVAVLVPTTLLAGQHYQTFCDRFADLPVTVDLLSRFRSKKEQTITLENLTSGKVDIIVGTHKLLQQDINFKNLGLLIIDEEHRFGVRQKEKLKSLRAKVDILTLTATPIPRTMNMSMAGMRDISIIATPPAKRLAIKTFINKRNKNVTREAILREITRGGQVFFLHNRVETINAITQELQELVPEANFLIAHGQMRERELERTMSDFYHRRFNVLVCTTIIENGIDIPTANTIIIDRADHFGLAQLHQLRGRVGRSHHQAYAYLIVPDKKSMTSDAKKRLDAFASLEDLGAGFNLAIHDLEIRGAGELLGEEQSGHINSIGYTLFMELLDRAVKALKNGDEPNLDLSDSDTPEINLHVSALIPDDYMPDIQNRLVLYRRISHAKDENALNELQVEMIDRFGLLPPQVKRLFRITDLKLLATTIGIRKIDANDKSIRIEFKDKPAIKASTIIDLIQKHSSLYSLVGPNRLRASASEVDHDKRIDKVHAILQKLLS